MQPLLSVIIPTKNRYQYLTGSLKTLAGMGSPELEIVVQDNSDDNAEMLDFISKLNHPGIKYFHSTEKLSQSGNSNLALKHATGEYCLYIGDDDTITEELLDVVRYMKKNRIQACVCDMASYYWPDVVFKDTDRKHPLSFNTFAVRIKTLDAKKVLEKCLKDGVMDIKYLPRVYHAVIHRSILEEIYTKTGTFFPGPSPDMANAVACALLLDKYIYINAPLIVSGVGYSSAAGMGQRGEHKGTLKSAKQLSPDVIAVWSDKIPKLWLGYTVWPESAEKALIAMDRRQYLPMLNYIAPLARTFIKFKEYRPAVYEKLDTPAKKIRFIFELANCGWLFIGRKFSNTIRAIRSKLYKNDNKISLEEAKAIVDSYYQKRCGSGRSMYQ